jgi:hypothetical protein
MIARRMSFVNQCYRSLHFAAKDDNTLSNLLEAIGKALITRSTFLIKKAANHLNSPAFYTLVQKN